MAESAEVKQVVRLEWGDIGELPTIFANQVAVTHASGEEFYLIFGEASPPTEMFKPGKLERVSIKPVAKIAIPPGSMLRIAQVIFKNAQNFIDRAGLGEEQDAEPEN